MSRILRGWPIILIALFTLTACGDNKILVTRNNVEVPLVPEGIAGNCPTEIEKVVPANGVQYSEEETGTVAKLNRIAYVDCRTVVRQIKEFYIEQNRIAERSTRPPQRSPHKGFFCIFESPPPVR